jgi:hypothetical protein
MHPVILHKDKYELDNNYGCTSELLTIKAQRKKGHKCLITWENIAALKVSKLSPLLHPYFT